MKAFKPKASAGNRFLVCSNAYTDWYERMPSNTLLPKLKIRKVVELHIGRNYCRNLSSNVRLSPFTVRYVGM